jgi:hypothetical protein
MKQDADITVHITPPSVSGAPNGFAPMRNEGGRRKKGLSRGSLISGRKIVTFQNIQNARTLVCKLLIGMAGVIKSTMEV